ncbi:MAG: hypothetical protein HYY18_19305 [Planctomycetes bacterium]|nr:hypothetical protein [Planctomycetota bacterium]
MLPDSIAKRDTLWIDHKTPPDFGAIGDQFFDAGWHADAVEFYLRAGDNLKLKKALDAAVRDGDAWLVGRLAATSPRLVERDSWRECALNAERSERFSYARAAWEKAGDAEKAAAARAKVLGILGYTLSKAPPNESHPPEPA